MMMDADGVIRCVVTPETARCLSDKEALQPSYPELTEEDDDNDYFDPNNKIFRERRAEILWRDGVE
jgi:hypothetical protein